MRSSHQAAVLSLHSSLGRRVNVYYFFPENFLEAAVEEDREDVTVALDSDGVLCACDVCL